MKAYEAIEQYGWRQNDNGSVQEGFCIAGAVDYVTPIYENVVPKFNAISALIPGGGSCSTWNDTVGRTKEEVIAILKAANI